MARKSPFVLLVNPWIVDFAAYDFWSKPIGLLTWGSILGKAGCEIKLLDCLDRFSPHLLKFHFLDKPVHRFYSTGHYHKEILDKPDVYHAVTRKYGRYGFPRVLVSNWLDEIHTPDLILLASGMTYWYPGVQEMTRLLKSRFPDTPVVLGGIYASLCPSHAAENSGADVIIQGSDFQLMAQILREILELDINNASYGSIQNMPWPDYSLYVNPGHAAILTGTGCPFRCPFCASHLLHPEFKRRKTDEIVRHIRKLHLTLNIRDFAFYDDALLVDAEHHLTAVCKQLIKDQLPVRFHTPNGIHPRMITSDLAKNIIQAGFKTIRLSYESKNPLRQKEMGFKVSDEELEKAVHYLKSAGAQVRDLGSYVMMGLPDQSIGEVIESMLYIFSLNIRVSLASFSPIPGTKSWKDAVKRGLIAENMDPLLTNNTIYPMVSDPEIKAKLTRLNSLVAWGNQKIVSGQSPLDDTEWISQIKKLS